MGKGGVMYYSSIGVIALIVHVIINYDLMKRVSRVGTRSVMQKRYRRFLIALIAYYLTDIIWGTLYENGNMLLTYIDTVAVFVTMTLSVLLWTRALIVFIDDKSKFGKIVLGGGWTIFLTEIIVLVVNFFYPIVFKFDEDHTYIALPARYVTMLMQMVLYCMAAFFALYIAFKSEGERRNHYRTVGFSSFIMAVFIALQDIYPLLPMYAIGTMFAACMVHSFVYNDVITRNTLQLENANQKAYRDGLTGVKNKLAYIDSLRQLELDSTAEALANYGVAVFDINDLKLTNDTKGHEAGDKLIKNACAIICKQFKHSPVFRIGGDEFAAILQGSDFENREDLFREFTAKIDENNKNGGVVVAGGMAVFDPKLDENYTDVFMRADQQMFERKEQLKASKTAG